METKLIGEIDWRDISVKVYYHPDNRHQLNCAECGWQMRNPETSYTGIAFMNNETGKITYPEDAIIPEQTDYDREMLPKHIIVGHEVLNDELIEMTKKYMDTNYILRNKKDTNGK